MQESFEINLGEGGDFEKEKLESIEKREGRDNKASYYNNWISPYETTRKNRSEELINQREIREFNLKLLNNVLNNNERLDRIKEFSNECHDEKEEKEKEENFCAKLQTELTRLLLKLDREVYINGIGRFFEDYDTEDGDWGDEEEERWSDVRDFRENLIQDRIIENKLRDTKGIEVYPSELQGAAREVDYIEETMRREWSVDVIATNAGIDARYDVDVLYIKNGTLVLSQIKSSEEGGSAKNTADSHQKFLNKLKKPEESSSEILERLRKGYNAEKWLGFFARNSETLKEKLSKNIQEIKENIDKESFEKNMSDLVDGLEEEMEVNRSEVLLLLSKKEGANLFNMAVDSFESEENINKVVTWAKNQNYDLEELIEDDDFLLNAFDIDRAKSEYIIVDDPAKGISFDVEEKTLELNKE